VLAAVMKSLKTPLSVEEVRTPRPGAGEVRVRIEASGLCTSDIHYMTGASPVAKTPIILGHEVAGVIHEVGPGINRLKPGDRVVVHYLVTCGTCAMCTSGHENFCSDCKMIGKTIDGGFAQFIVVPEANAIPIPDEVPIEHAALAADAIATPYHAVKLAQVRAGDTALIVGLGGLGLHAVQLPKLFGATTVIAVDVSEAKLKLAARLGADHVINAAHENMLDRVQEITSGKGIDVAVELIGLKKTLETSVKSLGNRGRMVIVGICPVNIEIDPYNDILLKEAVITGNCDHLASDIREVLSLVQGGKLDLSHSVSRCIKLSDINEGFRILREKENDPVRIVVTDMT
jgi:2-desacetyl-2-hydroxyethyl bacteriochlorophyllide A dehydrogenase